MLCFTMIFSSNFVSIIIDMLLVHIVQHDYVAELSFTFDIGMVDKGS